MERFFQILAVILAGVAAYFLLQGNADRAFVAAVGGAVSFFLSVRVQVKRRLTQREAARLAAEEEEELRSEEEEENGSAGDAEIEEDPDSEPAELTEIPATAQIDRESRTTNDEQPR
jgi:hypothetical protein